MEYSVSFHQVTRLNPFWIMNKNHSHLMAAHVKWIDQGRPDKWASLPQCYLSLETKRSQGLLLAWPKQVTEEAIPNLTSQPLVGNLTRLAKKMKLNRKMLNFSFDPLTGPKCTAREQHWGSRLSHGPRHHLFCGWTKGLRSSRDVSLTTFTQRKLILPS